VSATTLTRPAGVRTGRARPSGLVVVYARISRDRFGAGLGVERQLDECRELAADNGDRIANVFTDNDLSGWSSRKTRPGYDDLRTLIESGAVSVLYAWHVDRLTRRVSELSGLIELCQRHGVTIVTKHAGAFDVNNPGAIMAAQIQASVAEYESSIKSVRVKSKQAQLAAGGNVHGGKRRYGYVDSAMTELDAVETAAIREAAGRVLGGESRASIARDFNARGIFNSTGTRWTGSNIGALLVRPHLAGLRVHHGEVIGKGKWTPVLDEATHEALKLRIGVEKPTWKSNARTHLLSKIAHCGVCGSTMKSHRGTGGVAAYTCRVSGCVYRKADDVDQRVTDWVVERLSRTDARGLLADDSAAVELAELTMAAADIEARIEKLRDRWAAGKLTDDELDADRAALKAELERVKVTRAELAETVASPQRALAGLTGPDPVETFAELPLGRQRTVVELLCTVTVHPAARRGARFDPNTVVIEPK
jgi:site-specific DNA recombinase